MVQNVAADNHLSDNVSNVSNSPIHKDTIPVTTTSSDEEISSQSVINPVTPRSLLVEDNPLNSREADSENKPDKDASAHLITANWKPREPVSSSSNPKSTSDSGISIVEDNSRGSDVSQDEEHLRILKDLEKLKVKTKRGRPRKLNPKLINKHFKVPKKKKKSKGEGLQQISHVFLNNSMDEAESIYETGLMMGLLPVDSKEASLKLIKENLAC